MSVKFGFVLLFVLVTFESLIMHGLPCSSLGHCFGNPNDVNPDTATSQEPNISAQSKDNHGLSAAAPVTSQPGALPSSLQEQQHEQPQRTVSYISNNSTGTTKVNGTSSSAACRLQGTDVDLCFESSQLSQSVSQSSEDDELESECCLEPELKYPQIPRPSIIIRQPKVSLEMEINSHTVQCCI